MESLGEISVECPGQSKTANHEEVNRNSNRGYSTHLRSVEETEKRKWVHRLEEAQLKDSHLRS